MHSTILATTLALCAGAGLRAERRLTSFGYEGADGPDRWHLLDSAWAACGSGTEQSPIDIPLSSAGYATSGASTAAATQLQTLMTAGTGGTGTDPAGKQYKLTQSSYGGPKYSCQVAADGTREDCGTLTLDSSWDKPGTYKVLQFHFHHKSENTVDGTAYPMTMHIVHCDGGCALGTDQFAVVTILFSDLLAETSSSDASTLFDTLWKKIDADSTSTVDELTDPVNMRSLLPATSGYVTFKGSLTTPPCTEGLTWFVATEPVPLKASQINKYIAKIGGTSPGNARPVQPLNQRTITYHVDKPVWGYNPTNGPAMWGSMHPSWAVCDTGFEQSPINIPFASLGYTTTDSHDDPMSGLMTAAGTTAFKVVQSYGLPKFKCPSGTTCGTLTLGSDFEKAGTYALAQFHFHSSSENAIDGNTFPLCIHMVHCTGGCALGTDHFAVVTVLFTDTLAEADATSVAGLFFNEVFSPTNVAKSDGTAMATGVDPYALVGAASGYMTFPGSLTTPPCTEGLTWFITAEPVPIKASQVKAFWDHAAITHSYHGTERPVQPLHGRTITYKVDQHWGYTPADGPDKWGDSYPTCRNGKEQSPINIPFETAGYTDRTSSTNPLRGLVTSPTTVSAFKSKQAYGAPKYSCPTLGTCGTLQIPGIPDTYQLLQAHFHTESENTVDGNVFPMTIHMVHCTGSCSLGTDRFAVVNVLLDDKLPEADSSTASTLIQKLWGWQNERIGTSDGSLSEEVDFYSLIPATSGYATFMGSLTTPPCAEGLNWLVALTPVSLKKSQVLTYHNHIGGSYLGNARPVQPLHSRTITYIVNGGGTYTAPGADSEEEDNSAAIAGGIAGGIVGASVLVVIALQCMGRKRA